MKKSIMASAAALALCAMALAAAAQQERNVTTSKDKADTVKINVSGQIELDYVWRSKEMTQFTASVFNFLGATNNATSENTFEGVAAIRVDAELSDKVGAVLEVGTLRVAPVGNALSGINFMGTPIGGLVGMREAQIKLNELLMPELAVKAGIMDWSFDVRGKGNGFVFDPRHSQGISRNLGAINFNGQESALTVLNRAALPSEQYPVGGVVSYTRDAMKLDLVLLPAVQEYGSLCQDENLYALDFWYNLEQVGKGSRIGVVAAASGLGTISSGPGTNHTTMYTIGGGVELKGLGGQDGLEIYGEIYKQLGKVAESINIGGQSEEVDAKGLAFQVGAEYHFNDPMGVWVGINYTYFSGDGDDTANTDSDRFHSYENVSDLLIVEDMYFGLDIDSNYTAIKFSGGVALSVGTGKNNLEISAIIGLCNMQEDVTTSVAGDTTKKLGTEFDVKARYHLSKQASLSAAFAMLTGSDVLEEGMLLNGTPQGDEESSCYLYTLGLDVKF
jgi:opacity protein-like surface antigen